MDREFVARLAVEAGEIVKRRAGAAIIRPKGETDIVTDADEAAERFLREEILRRFPDHRVVGEEYGSQGAQAEWEWVIDPLDGTVNFSRGSTYFAVSIALARHGQAQIGAVYRPFTEELFLAERGGGATLNGNPIHVSPVQRVAQSIVVLDWSQRDTRRASFARMERVFLAAHKIRSLGSAALDLCSVAAGQLEGFVHPGLAPWDFAAGQLIVEEAGGQVTTLEGTARTIAPGSVLATNGHIHSETLMLLTQ